jgi:hypothetical protein
MKQEEEKEQAPVGVSLTPLQWVLVQQALAIGAQRFRELADKGHAMANLLPDAVVRQEQARLAGGLVFTAERLENLEAEIGRQLGAPGGKEAPCV